MITRLKRRSDGSIFSLTSTVWGSDGTFMYLMDKDGVKYKYTEGYVKSKFDVVNFDIDKYIPYLKEYFMNCPKDEQNILGAIARRHTPGGYFHVEDIVYFITPQYCDSSTGRTSYGDILWGPEHPYRIESIREDRDRKGLFWISLIRGYRKGGRHFSDADLKKKVAWYDESSITVPMYMDIYTKEDAFSVLSKYGEEY